MRYALILAFLVQIAIASIANAAGPYGNIHVGNWKGGAFTDDNTGAFSHCGATSSYGNGVILVVGLNANNNWLLGFANPAFHLTKGSTTPIDVTFDGQSQARLFGTATSEIMMLTILPPNVARAFQKASLMVAVSGNNALNFNLTSTAPLLAVLTNCVSTVKAGGINSAGEFTAPKPVAAKPDAPGNPKAGKTGSQTGTGFVISASGHIITNHHVIDGCVGDIKGNLTGDAAATLRVVNSDSANDLALLQGPAESFKAFAKIRDRTIHSGDSVVAIGFPYHGLLSSDFTVTTGIVSSLSGMLNDTRRSCKISARTARQQRRTAAGHLGRDRWHGRCETGCPEGRPLHRHDSGEHQFRHQDRRDPRLPRQQRRPLRDRRPRHRTQDRRHRYQRARLHPPDFLYGERADGNREAVGWVRQRRSSCPGLPGQRPRLAA